MLVIEPTKGRGLTDWSEINWTAVERNVKRVQGRIFRAAKPQGSEGLSRVPGNWPARF